jgi:hypothetical protein
MQRFYATSNNPGIGRKCPFFIFSKEIFSMDFILFFLLKLTQHFLDHFHGLDLELDVFDPTLFHKDLSINDAFHEFFCRPSVYPTFPS